jgi:hypothetical protein
MAKVYKSKAAAQKNANKACAKSKKDFITEGGLYRVGALGSGDLDMRCRWKCSKAENQIDHFDVDVEYLIGSTWYELGNGTASVPPTSKAGGYYTYVFSAPNNDSCTKVRYRVRAVAKTKSVKRTYKVASYTVKKGKVKKSTSVQTSDFDIAYWTAGWSSYQTANAPAVLDAAYQTADARKKAAAEAKIAKMAAPERPNAPRAELDGDTVTVEFGAVDEPATSVDVFRREDGGAWGMLATVDLSASRRSTEDPEAVESVQTTVAPGHVYDFCIAAYNSNSKTWSPYSEQDSVTARPAMPETLDATAYSSTEALLDIGPGGAVGDGYKVYYSEYADAWELDHGIQEYVPTARWNPAGTQVVVSDLDSGKEWFFRVAATNESGESDLSPRTSTVLASEPEAPTLAAMPPSVQLGEPVDVSWTHNCEDGCAQVAAEVSVAVDGTSHTIAVAAAMSCTLDPAALGAVDGSALTVQVRTKGLTGNWSPWSAPAAFSVWTPPTIVISASCAGEPVGQGSPMTSLPLDVVMTSTAAGRQSVATWSLDLSTAEDIRSYVGTDGELRFMAAGTSMATIIVDASDASFDPAEQHVSIDASMGAFVTGGEYALTATATFETGLTATAELEFTFEASAELPAPDATVDIFGDWAAAIYPFCADEETGDLIEGVTLSVYRIDAFDVLVPIAAGIPNDGRCVIDPHPDFREVTYRITANDAATDAVSVNDLDPVDVPAERILIQWDEAALPADGDPEAAAVASSETLELAADVSIQEGTAKDVTYNSYAGQALPTADYGTDPGLSGGWTARFPRVLGTETLRQLRKLEAWMGPVYVREPYGSGYWANADVSVSQPGGAYSSVSLTIRRVDAP